MKRVITALVGVPAVIALTKYAPHWLFALVIAGFAGICFNELMALGAAKTGIRPGSWTAVAAAAVTASFVGNAEWVVTVLAAVLVFCCIAMTFDGPLDSMLPSFNMAAAGLIYCGVLLGFLIWLRTDVVFTLLGVVWAGDSAAYYGGRALGRHRLAPEISPNKTVEGSVSGLLGSVAAGVALGKWLLGGSVEYLALVSLIAGVAGQAGDLMESALKRSAGVKDSSAILPGHGGMLDRLDSLMFAAPVFYWFFRT
jgi:phosphatidate cytidylyltransferase